MKLPTQRSLESWRKRGFLCDKTEYYHKWARCLKDLFGFIDVIAFRFNPVKEIVALQCTTDSHHATRKKKILTELKVAEYAYKWLLSSGKICVCSWGMRGKEGKRKLWQERVEEIKLEDFSPVIVSQFSLE